MLSNRKQVFFCLVWFFFYAYFGPRWHGFCSQQNRCQVMTKTGKNEFRCFCQFWREKTISLFSSVLAEKGDFTVFVHFNEKEWFQCFSPFWRKKVILLFLSIFEKKSDFNFRAIPSSPTGWKPVGLRLIFDWNQFGATKFAWSITKRKIAWCKIKLV